MTMTAKEYLLRYRQADKHAKAIASRIEDYYQGLGSPKAIEYSDMPRAHNSERDMSDSFVRLEDMCEEWRQRMHESRRIMCDIMRRIDAMEDSDESRVLELRYTTRWIDAHGREQVGLLPWEAVAARMGYSRIQVIRIHGTALQHIEIPEEENREKRKDDTP